MRDITGIEDAVEKAGGQVKMALQLGVTQQAVSKWVRGGSVPVRRALEIEAQYGVPRSRLISPRLIDLVDMPVDSEGGHCD